VKHETFKPEQLSTRDIYRLMTDLVAPRPIAWVSTLDADGRGNLAPFSYFQAVGSRPPTIVLGIGLKADGRPKDTLRNILERREFTVSHVSEPLAVAMNATSAELDEGQSEWELAGEGRPLASLPAVCVAPPRVAEARAALECRLTHAIPLGRGPTGKAASMLVIAEIVCFTVAEGFVTRDERGHLRSIEPARLAAVGRLGGIAYTGTIAFDMPRPKV
jgi:flavin reductase (DIM6/NTAB) family NADH-FMN oxidoreductase RutF